jgi:hypothetical protein
VRHAQLKDNPAHPWRSYCALSRATPDGASGAPQAM